MEKGPNGSSGHGGEACLDPGSDDCPWSGEIQEGDRFPREDETGSSACK